MVDLLLVLEGMAYIGFIAGAIFAVWELRTMSRDRQTEFIMRVNEHWTTRDFQDGWVKVRDIDSKDSKEIERICTRQSLRMIVEYLDGLGSLAQRNLLKRELVTDLLAWDLVWDQVEPWIASERQRLSNEDFAYGFEFCAKETRRWRASLKSSS